MNPSHRSAVAYSSSDCSRKTAATSRVRLIWPVSSSASIHPSIQGSGAAGRTSQPSIVMLLLRSCVSKTFSRVLLSPTITNACSYV